MIKVVLYRVERFPQQAGDFAFWFVDQKEMDKFTYYAGLVVFEWFRYHDVVSIGNVLSDAVVNSIYFGNQVILRISLSLYFVAECG